MKKACLNCGVEFRGRLDKKYCSPSCRNEYNNARYRSENSEIRRINGILKRNQQVLVRLNPEGKTVVSRSKMLAAGFDFGFFTSLYTTKQGRTYYYCYDQGYCLDENEDRVLLVVKQEYMK